VTAPSIIAVEAVVSGPAPAIGAIDAPTIISPRVVPPPSPVVVWIVPSPTPKVWVVPAIVASPAPTVVVYIYGQTCRVIAPTRISIVIIVISKVIGLLAIRNGVVLHLTGIAVNVGKDLAVQYLAIFVCLFAKIIFVDITFLLFDS